MRLNVLLPSRGRPTNLLNAVGSMHGKASGQHEVNYVIGCDADDQPTIAAAHLLRLRGPRVIPFCTVRLPCLGMMANIMAEKYPADVYCSLPDDVEILTQDWDQHVWAAWAARPDGLWWWQTLAVRPATCAIISEKWRQAAGQIYTDYFPFWWDDVWLMQVWHMASGTIGQAVNATLDDRAFATHRMRDLRFWSDFYTSRKEERWQHAERIAANLGWPKPVRGEVHGDVREEFLRDIPKIEAHQGDKGPLTPEYLKAKARAEAMMKRAA